MDTRRRNKRKSDAVNAKKEVVNDDDGDGVNEKVSLKCELTLLNSSCALTNFWKFCKMIF